ncbi:MAG: hypothetical protein H6598_04640 [Flavobacteriales bacterium]|nr:hypothetical protein [Flavobacteriales bacterium]
MKKVIQYCLALFASTILAACGGISKEQPNDAASFVKLQEVIIEKFGKDAYFTELNVGYIKDLGPTISLTVTDNPGSLKMGDWTFSQNTWSQHSEVTLELPEGTKAEDFMFQLDDEINLKTLGEVTEKSITKLAEEKELTNPLLKMAYIHYPDNGDRSKADYTVTLEPENGGTSFSFFYDLSGEFIEMNY